MFSEVNNYEYMPGVHRIALPQANQPLQMRSQFDAITPTRLEAGAARSRIHTLPSRADDQITSARMADRLATPIFSAIREGNCSINGETT
jgi:hypothetical protein